MTDFKGMIDELRPCPFCGGAAIAREGMLAVCDWEIHCTQCDVSSGNFGQHEHGPLKGDDNSAASKLNKQEACAAWNSRTHAIPPSSLMEQLENCPSVEMGEFSYLDKPTVLKLIREHLHPSKAPVERE